MHIVRTLMDKNGRIYIERLIQGKQNKESKTCGKYDTKFYNS